MKMEVEKGLGLEELMRMGEVMGQDGLKGEECCGGELGEEDEREEGEGKGDEEKLLYVGWWEQEGREEKGGVLQKEGVVQEGMKVESGKQKR